MKLTQLMCTIGQLQYSGLWSIFGLIFVYIYAVQFRELQEFGYHAVAYGFYGGVSEIVYMTNCSLGAEPKVIQYIHGVILTGIVYIIAFNALTTS